MRTPDAFDAFGESLRAAFVRHSTRPAIRCGGVSLSYAELDHHAGALAGVLAEAGVMPGDCVPLLIRRSINLVVAQLAVLRLGAIYAPIDMASPAERRALMLEVLQARLCIAETLADCPVEALLPCIDMSQLELGGLPCQHNWLAPPEQAAAYVMFTSGTTGAPKGVLVPRSGILRLVQDGACGAFYEAGQRWGFLSSPAFDASTLEVWAPLFNGGCCVVQEQSLPSIDALAEFLIGEQISATWLTASLFNLCVDLRPDAFAGLCQVLTGGERVSPRHARVLLERYPSVRLINGYGPTENTTFTLCHTVSLADCDDPAGIPVGRPIRGTVVRIDGEGDSGELLAGGEGLAYGYLNNPEQTARKFLNEGENRWYRTGDLVRRRHDGVHEFIGRVDHQVKIQGHRVELEEIEALLTQCEGVGEAAVLLVGDDAISRHLVAFYSSEQGFSPDEREILGSLARHLPPPAVPKVLRQVRQMPLNANGKIDRKALQASIEEEAQLPACTTNSRFASETEAELAGLWRECLHKTALAREADFWEQGGTSVIALQLSARIGSHFSKDFPPVEILRHPLLADQARRLDALPIVCRLLREADAGLHLPLSESQLRLMDLVLEHPGTGICQRRIVLRFAASQTVEAVCGAFRALASLHPSLRMILQRDEENSTAHAFVQAQWPDACCVIHAASSNTPEEDPAGFRSLIDRCCTLNPFEQGLMLGNCWPLSDGTVLFVWTVHELALDSISIERCLDQLHEILSGQTPAPAYGAMAAFPALERAWSDASQIERCTAEILAHAPGIVIPCELTVPAAARTSPLYVPAVLSERLATACENWQTSPALLVLVAWSNALQSVHGFSPLVMMSCSRRLEPELIEPIGYLVEECPIFAAQAANESLCAAIERVRRIYAGYAGPASLGIRNVEAALKTLSVDAGSLFRSFAFSWEDALPLERTMGHALCGLQELPSVAARFGLELKASLLDGQLVLEVSATEAVWNTELVESIERIFLQQLEAICGGDDTVRQDRLAARMEPEVDGFLLQLWLRHLGGKATQATSSDNFLVSGGRISQALRMLVDLRRLHGVHLDAGRFLAHPSLANLAHLVEPHATQPSVVLEVIGSADASRLLVLLPGKHGGVLSVYRLATLIQESLGDDVALVLLDLDLLLEAAEGRDTLDFLVDECEARLLPFGAERIAGIIGYSLGGLLALRLATRLSAQRPPPVCLLDTYAPGIYTNSMPRRLGWITSNLLFGSSHVVLVKLCFGVFKLLSPLLAKANLTLTFPLRLPEPPAWEKWVNPRTLTAWQTVHQLLSLESARNERIDVTLIVAGRSLDTFGVLWRRMTNGFKPSWFRDFRIRRIPLQHDDITHQAVGEAAECVAKEFARGL